jgi:3-oxoacyl-[acyl-carrier protein] reductase
MNKTILITGATSGIGEAIASNFFKKGYPLILTYRKKSKIKEWQKNNPKYVKMIKFDLANQNDLNKICNDIKKAKIKFDILINNAGIYNFKESINFSFNDLNSEFMINCFAPVMLSSSFASQLKKGRKMGKIINITSFASEMPSFGRSIYAASKSALKTFTKTLAAELSALNLATVNGISPGVIPTNINRDIIKKNKKKLLKPISLKKFGSTDDISNCIEFLISEKSKYINGTTIDISGGKYLIQNQEDAKKK